MYSIIFFMIILAGLLLHIRFVEEKELIARFGKPFLKYREKVPALLVRPRKIGAYFRFIAGHKENPKSRRMRKPDNQFSTLQEKKKKREKL
jgi:hypothetical protein